MQQIRDTRAGIELITQYGQRSVGLETAVEKAGSEHGEKGFSSERGEMTEEELEQAGYSRVQMRL